MSRCRVAVLVAVVLCLAALSHAQPTDPPLVNWTAPPYWTPPAVQHLARPQAPSAQASSAGRDASAAATPETPLTGNLPFVAVTPCRLVDTKHAPHKDVLQPGGGTPSGYPRGTYASGEIRSYDLTSSTDCTGLPAGVGAWSLQLQFITASQAAYLEAWPYVTSGGIGGQTVPAKESTMLGYTDRWTANSAIIPAGNDANGSINVFVQYVGDVIIEVNGYYAPVSALYLPYHGSASSPALTDLFTIENTGAGRAMHAIAVSDTALWAQSTSGSGVDGRSSAGVGVYGGSTSAQGVWGVSDSSASYGVYGQNNGNSAYGYLGGVVGVYGNGDNAGVMGESTGGKGVHGKSTSFDGVWGEASASGKSGVYGFNSDSGGFGVTGRNTSNSNHGYLGGAYGVYGYTNVSNAGVYGENAATTGTGAGVYGKAVSPDERAAGVYGENLSTTGKTAGVFGIAASSDTEAAGVVGITGMPTSNAGYFSNTTVGVYVDVATEEGGTGGYKYGIATNGDMCAEDIRAIEVDALTKHFVAPHPEDPSKEIVYTSVEAPTADVYFRGTAHLENGLARIEIPDHFRLTAREGSYMTTVTALAAHADLWVEQQDERGIVVRGSGSAPFTYVVWAERDLYRDEKAVRENDFFTPAVLERIGALRTLPERVKEVLVKNGTLNPDGTYNRQTAERLNWTIPDARTRWLR